MDESPEISSKTTISTCEIDNMVLIYPELHQYSILNLYGVKFEVKIFRKSESPFTPSEKAKRQKKKKRSKEKLLRVIGLNMLKHFISNKIRKAI